MSYDEPAKEMSLGGHLDELRKRMLSSLLFLGVLFFVFWLGFAEELKAIFMHPHLEAVDSLLGYEPPIVIDRRLVLHSPLEDVFYTLKVCFLSSVILSLPVLLYHVWGFISAGLYRKEKVAVLKYIPFSLLFAFSGIAFGYAFMIPTILEFLYAMPNSDLVLQAYRLEYYFSLFMMFTLALSLVFQLPILMLGICASGLVSPKVFIKYRKYFILFAFVLSAILTPPEPISQLLMALPTIMLFEIGILLVRVQKNIK